MQDNNQTSDTQGGMPDPETNDVSPSTPTPDSVINQTTVESNPVVVNTSDVNGTAVEIDTTATIVTNADSVPAVSKKHFLLQYGIAALVVLVM